jgi:hypothetical protein
MKKDWVKPALIVYMKSTDEETTLTSCKTIGCMSGYPIGVTNCNTMNPNGGCYEGCFACYGV